VHLFIIFNYYYKRLSNRYHYSRYDHESICNSYKIYYKSIIIKLPKIGNNLQMTEKHKTKPSKAKKRQTRQKQSKI
jgi:hypothetical protein